MINSAWDGRECVDALEALEAVEARSGSLLRFFCFFVSSMNQTIIIYIPSCPRPTIICTYGTSIYYCQLIIDKTMIQSSISPTTGYIVVIALAF